MIRPTISVDGIDLHTRENLRTVGNLAIQWGRRTRLSQPRPAAMTLSVLLDKTDDETLDWLAPGKRFIVTAAAPESEPRRILDAASMHRVAGRPSNTLSLHPAPIEAAGGNPAAWDRIPRLTSSSRLRLRFTAALPPRSVMIVRAYYYADPFLKTRISGGTVYTASKSGAHDTRFSAPIWSAGMWCGLEFGYASLGESINQDSRFISSASESFDSLEKDSISNIHLDAEASSTVATILSGRLTDAVLSFDEKEKCPRLDLTGLDFSAELANVFFGAPPFLPGDVSTRLKNILAHSGTLIDSYADQALHTVPLARKDVDRQSVADLLYDAAQSVGGILWPVSHSSGDYFRVEDPAQRPSLFRLEVHDGMPVITSTPYNGIEFPARLVYRRGIRLAQDTTDLATRVQIVWRRDFEDDNGMPAQAEETETSLDHQRIRDYGVRTLRYSTSIGSQAAARALAERLLTQTAPGGWHLPEANAHTRLDGFTPQILISLLDSSQRIGLPVTLTGVDHWIPGSPSIPVYLDGGRYEYDGKHWTLNLSFTRAATVSKSVTIDQFPLTLTFDAVDLPIDTLAATTI